jgi:hypothetical protein
MLGQGKVGGHVKRIATFGAIDREREYTVTFVR